MKTPREKYENDNHFKALVDMMQAYISNCDFTPSEMRQAAILASIIYQERHIGQILIPKHIEESLETAYEWYNSGT